MPTSYDGAAADLEWRCVVVRRLRSYATNEVLKSYFYIVKASVRLMDYHYWLRYIAWQLSVIVYVWLAGRYIFRML